jgi:RHS repeat-associated protein
VIKRRPGGETFYVNQWYVDAAGKNSKHVFAGTTRIATKLEMPSNGGGGYEKFQYFYHPDHLGSTSYVTNELGEVDQHYETFPFGESWIEEATGQADKVTPYRFTGKEWDSETQLYYFGARYYDPRTSLWTSMDPALGEYLPNLHPVAKQSDGVDLVAPSLASDWRSHVDLLGEGGTYEPKNLSLASYVGNSPLRYIDPDGKAARRDSLEGKRGLEGGSGGSSGSGGTPTAGPSPVNAVKSILNWFGRGGFPKWRRGEPIDKVMPNGEYPSWDVVRSRYWKNRYESTKSTGEFSKANQARMRSGQAPLDKNPRTGKLESRELHHNDPQRNMNSDRHGPLNLREVTPDQHRALDPYRQ